jgi:hypothetical protein
MTFSSLLILTFLLPSVSYCCIDSQHERMSSCLSLFSIKILRPTPLWHALSNAPYNARASFLIWEAEGTSSRILTNQHNLQHPSLNMLPGNLNQTNNQHQFVRNDLQIVSKYFKMVYGSIPDDFLKVVFGVFHHS